MSTPNIYYMRKDPASVDEFIAAGRRAQDSHGALMEMMGEDRDRPRGLMGAIGGR